MNVYELLDGFVSFECTKADHEKNKPQSIKTQLAGIKSYFAYYDIDIIPSKFKRKVKMPRTIKEKEEPRMFEKSYCRAIIAGLKHIF
jgi:hypothetical protein